VRTNDAALRELIEATVADDLVKCSHLIGKRPELAAAYFQDGATRQAAKRNFLPEIGRYILAGDTALHFAAAAYRTAIAGVLIGAEACVRAKNRHGAEPLHAAAVGQPGSPNWNPDEQSHILDLLIDAGADPNTIDKRGVTPLHIAVRTRCANAVRTLLQRGADPTRKNKSGSTPLRLANLTTGRSGSGSEEAKLQQQQILRMLEARISGHSAHT
jgi:hypothetical protein